MNPQLLASAIFLLLFLAIIVAAQFMYRASVDTEKSRKFVHVSGGILSLFLPYYIHSHWYVLGLCSVAFLTLLITWIRKDLPGIHKTKRKSVGSVIFPIPIYVCFAVACERNEEMLFHIPVLLLTFSDTFAELGGKKWGKYGPEFFGGKKTLIGSLFFFVSAAAILLVFFPFGTDDPGIKYLVGFISIALAATVAELVSMNGWDNLTVPLVVLAGLWTWFSFLGKTLV